MAINDVKPVDVDFDSFILQKDDLVGKRIRLFEGFIGDIVAPRFNFKNYVLSFFFPNKKNHLYIIFNKDIENAPYVLASIGFLKNNPILKKEIYSVPTVFSPSFSSGEYPVKKLCIGDKLFLKKHDTDDTYINKEFVVKKKLDDDTYLSFFEFNSYSENISSDRFCRHSPYIEVSDPFSNDYILGEYTASAPASGILDLQEFKLGNEIIKVKPKRGVDYRSYK